MAPTASDDSGYPATRLPRSDAPDRRASREPGRVSSVAVLCMHTSPLHQPGSGDGGGLNVYVRELTAALAHLGVECDIYTRRTDPSQPDAVDVEPGVRVTHVDAGAPSLDKDDMPAVVATFVDQIAEHLVRRPVDAIHAHYWLSGMAGHELKHRLDVPLAVTFHTLGRVKTSTGDAEPRHRGDAEQRIIDCADAVFTSGDAEASQLQSLYDVPFERVHVLTPGVNRAMFAPGQRHAARAAIGLPPGPVLLFVGRLQPLKGAELAVETLAATRVASSDGAQAQLVIVGGPSGPQGESTLARLRAMADDLSVADHVRFVEPLPHHLLSTYYRAADVCLVPSRSESFGLVALEAAACGTPVVASDVGGLRDNVVESQTGYLIAGRDADAYARRVTDILTDPLLALRLGDAGSRRAERFSWRASATAALEALDTAARRELVACV
ncbi:glycosyltransferase [Candidatus Poriferisodalis sp.]|uniref:glycosyltransferase n=1 Tax=Candidatus Poriferisodalis sp. TaxID=3101277 RepID=UPI003B5906F3